MYSIFVRDRVFLDRFRCIDTEREIKIFPDTKVWRSGGLLYMVNGFNTACISVEDILRCPGEFKKYMQ